MKSYLRKVDTNTIGNRNDVTPLFADANCFSQLVDDMAAPFINVPLDCVACIDALGFILGTAIACRLEVGVIPIRKGGKLPVEVDRVAFTDYSGKLKQLEIRKDILTPHAQVLLVDEWIETGAQIRAAAELIEGQGGFIVGIATINIDRNDMTRDIRGKYQIYSAWDFDDRTQQAP